jgi:hypothetical protein
MLSLQDDAVPLDVGRTDVAGVAPRHRSELRSNSATKLCRENVTRRDN